MTKKEAQDLLGVSERTLDGYVKKYGLTVQYVPGKTGRRANYDADELAKLKEQLEAPQSSATGVNTPSISGDEAALAIVPQSTAMANLRGSAPVAGADMVVLPLEYMPALVQALGVQPHGVAVADRLTLDLDGAAELSGFSKGFIRDAIGKNELRAKKIGRGWKIERAALEEWVKALFRN